MRSTRQKKRYSYFSLAALMTCIACSQAPVAGKISAQETVPYVVSYAPASATIVDSSGIIQIKFSVEIKSDSVTEDSVLLISGDYYAEASGEDWEDFHENILEDVAYLSITSVLSPDRRHIEITVGSDIADGEYVILIMPTLKSIYNTNLDQNYAGDVVRYFSLPVSINRNGHASTVLEDATDTFTELSDATADSQAQNTAEDIASENKPGDPVSSGSVDDTESDIVSTDQVTLPQGVFISEVVTDPQQDHNDSSGGDGIAFNAVVGGGSITDSDEYIELKNYGSDADISNWKISMLDGTDVTSSLNESFTYFFSDDSTLDSFHSGQSLVLGNPSGTINNEITIELYNENDEIIDSVSIDDGNSTTTADESYTYDPVLDSWSHDHATPGF